MQHDAGISAIGIRPGDTREGRFSPAPQAWESVLSVAERGQGPLGPRGGDPGEGWGGKG